MRNFSSVVTIALAVIIVTLVVLFPSPNPIAWDVFGYYLYLPATFIYNDPGMKNISVIENIIQTYDSTATFYQAQQTDQGYWIIMYSMGMAVLYAPFFFISHLFALMSDFAADGFSLPYQWGIRIGSLAYTLTGLYFFRKILLKFFDDRTTAIVLMLIVLGSNYFHIVVYSFPMAHNYLFTLYTLILWFTIRWHESRKLKHILWCAFFCGLCILSRPSEMICLLIPALWGIKNKETWIKKIQLLWEKKFQISLFALVVIAIGIPQLIYWKAFSGHFLYFSYSNAGEGFEFLNPYILEILFSFRKGWFVYTPLMIFAMLGIYIMIKKSWENSFALIAFIILNTYIVSSWSCWWYAESFSQRALMQSYALLAFPLGFFIKYLNDQKFSTKIVLSVVLIFIVFLNLFQTWQVNKWILHPSRMTFSYYLSIFGKTDVQESDQKLLLVHRSFDRNEVFENEKDFEETTIAFFNFEEENKGYNLSKEFSFSGASSFMLDSKNIYSPGVEKPFTSLTEKDYAWIRITAMIYPVSDLKLDPASLIVTFQHKEKNYKYAPLDFENLEYLQINKWNKITFDYLTPEVRNKNDKLKVYIWNRGKQNLYVDDLKVAVFEPQ